MTKQLYRAGLTALLLTLWACTSRDRLYEPSCIAYEGDTVVLRDSRFEWRKFTDQIPIGADREPVDPFPDYPKSGTYRQENGRVEFKPDDGSQFDDYFMVDFLGAHYLLTEEQHQKFVVDRELQTCALRLIDAE
jgi:hypothetical protein